MKRFFMVMGLVGAAVLLMATPNPNHKIDWCHFPPGLYPNKVNILSIDLAADGSVGPAHQNHVGDGPVCIGLTREAALNANCVPLRDDNPPGPGIILPRGGAGIFYNAQATGPYGGGLGPLCTGNSCQISTCDTINDNGTPVPLNLDSTQCACVCPDYVCPTGTPTGVVAGTNTCSNGGAVPLVGKLSGAGSAPVAGACGIGNL